MITSKCNMRCAHCGFSCTEKGEDMSLETFQKAINLASDNEEYICLGGGEPTIHPLFERFLLEAIAISDKDVPPYIVTNGKETNRAIMIARLIKNGVIGGKLSQDIYHESIDPKVVKMFKKIGDHGITGISNVTKDNLVYSGRAKRIKNSHGGSPVKRCFCEEIFVRPNGIIYQCGCKDAPVIGNVDNGYDSPCPGECYHSQEYQNELRQIKIAKRYTKELVEV